MQESAGEGKVVPIHLVLQETAGGCRAGSAEDNSRIAPLTCLEYTQKGVRYSRYLSHYL